MTVTLAILAVHALSTLMMTGLIWFVQLVHYPLMQWVGGQHFVQYEREHVRRTTWIVAPLMCLEALSAGMLLTVTDTGTAYFLAIIGLILVGLVWACTACLQVPCHRRLSAGPDGVTAKRLVATNWIRTTLWTGRACIAISLPFLIPLHGKTLSASNRQGSMIVATVQGLGVRDMAFVSQDIPPLATAEHSTQHSDSAIGKSGDSRRTNGS